MAAKLPNALVGYRGDDIEHLFRFQEPKENEDDPTIYVDFTGWTGTSQLRRCVDDTDSLGDFTVTVLDQITDRGKIRVEMAAAVSALVPIVIGNLKWDLQMITAGGKKDTLIYANYKMLGDVTRP